MIALKLIKWEESNKFCKENSRLVELLEVIYINSEYKAGGGGCMIFYTKDKNSLIKAAKELEAEKKFPLFKVIEFKFDYEGIK